MHQKVYCKHLPFLLEVRRKTYLSIVPKQNRPQDSFIEHVIQRNNTSTVCFITCFSPDAG